MDKSFVLGQYFLTIFPLSYDNKPQGLGIQTLGQGANILLVDSKWYNHEIAF